MRLHGLWRRLRCEAAVALAGAALTTVAQAQLGGTIAVESDSRYRGVSLSDSRPSLRLTLNYDAPARWYAGGSVARPALTATGSHTQALGYAGWVGPPVDGRSLEIGITGSHFAGIGGYDYAEAYAGVLADRWSLRLYYSPKYYGRHLQVSYLELDAHIPIAERGRLFAHLGGLIPLESGRGDDDTRRFDASIGAGVVWGAWDVHLAASAVTPHGPYPAVYTGRRSALVAGASVSF